MKSYDIKLVLYYLPAFFIKPWSARIVWQSSQVKHSTCQLLFIAFITRPDMKVLHFPQQGANRTWKSCLQYFLPSNWKSNKIIIKITIKITSTSNKHIFKVQMEFNIYKVKIVPHKKFHLEMVWNIDSNYKMNKFTKQKIIQISHIQ